MILWLYMIFICFIKSVTFPLLRFLDTAVCVKRMTSSGEHEKAHKRNQMMLSNFYQTYWQCSTIFSAMGKHSYPITNLHTFGESGVIGDRPTQRSALMWSGEIYCVAFSIFFLPIIIFKVRMSCQFSHKLWLASVSLQKKSNSTPSWCHYNISL